jgi:hypothetical protein
MRNYLIEKVVAPVWTTEINDHGGSATLHATPFYPQKLALKNSLTSGGHSVGIIRLQTKGHRVLVFVVSVIFAILDNRLSTVSFNNGMSFILFAADCPNTSLQVAKKA